MKFLHSTSVLLAVCLSAFTSDVIRAEPHALCGSGDTATPTTTPSITPAVSISAPTTTSTPTTPAPTTAAPRVPRVELKNSQFGAVVSLTAPSYRICYNLEMCIGSGFDSLAFYNFDVYRGATVLPFYEADCTTSSWGGYISIFRDMEGGADVRSAPTGRTYKSFVVQGPGDVALSPSYTKHDVCFVA